MNEFPLALAKTGVNASIAASNHAGRQNLKGLMCIVSYQRFSSLTRNRRQVPWVALGYAGFGGRPATEPGSRCQRRTSQRLVWRSVPFVSKLSNPCCFLQTNIPKPLAESRV